MTDTGWRSPEEIDADDAEAARMLDEVRRNVAISTKADELRILEEARARVRAEKVRDINFAEQFLTRSALSDLPTPEPLIERVLPRHAYAILRGRDQSFKSFVAIDWACCLATGKSWQGHTAEPVRVLYIAGEGAHGIAGRLDAWEYSWGHMVPDDMLTVRTTAPNMHQPGPAFDHLLEHIRQGQYGLVIVDTLRRVSGAADGNSSEMGLVVDNLDLIKQATTDGSVLVVAHTGKDDKDTRGYSGIEDDADVVWSVVRRDMYLDLELTKFKDGADGRSMQLEASRFLGSLILTGTSGPPEINTTESQAKILAALRVMPEGGVTGPDLMATAELKKPTFYRALDPLIATQQVIRTSTGRTKYYELPGLVDDQGTEPEPTADDNQQPTLDQEDPQ